MQVHEKVGKTRFTVFSQWFVAPESRKVGSLKRRVQSHVVRWDMQKNCTPLWREAHFQVKSADAAAAAVDAPGSFAAEAAADAAEPFPDAAGAAEVAAVGSAS